jgi:hypothetical protein
MSAILEAEQITLVGIDMRALRQFALREISVRLASEPGLVSAFWEQIGEPAEPPNLTAIYCSVRWSGQTYALSEFVAGETLEELVKRSDPAACEQEIPLFCRVLDSFEGPARLPNEKPAPQSDFELVDFGIGRATAVLTSRLHGAVLAGPDGYWSDSVFGEYGASRTQIFAALMELCAQLPGDLPRITSYGAAMLGTVSACSLSAVPSCEAPPAGASLTRSSTSERAMTEAPPVRKRRSLVRTLAPYFIALATTALVLLTFYGVGSYLARRTVTPDAGKLILPPMPVEPPEPNLELAPLDIRRDVPRAITKHSKPLPVVKEGATLPKKAARQPTPSIVLTRGARPVLQTSLQYPAEAAKEHVTGLVEMQLTIAEDGSVQSERVLSGDPLLRSGLAEEVSHWVYQPLRVNGKPVPMTTELAIRFTLN